jgi:hypothetical protein
LDAGNDETLGTLSWPASKKRQGTKSREVWHRPGSESYGDLMPASTSLMEVTQARCDLRMGAQATSRAYNGHLSAGSERTNAHSAH